jgi:hypothetical protein
MHQQQEQQQQQQQQISEVHNSHSNLANSPPATLTRSDSTSTVILEEEETRTCRRNGAPIPPPSTWANLSATLRSLLKTSGLFNNNWESSDRLSELLATGDGFALQKLLSEAGNNDANIDMNELFKLDSMKFPDARTLSEFLRSESFDQLIASAATNNTDLLATPPAVTCSSSSFSELRPLSPELTTNDMFRTQSNQLKSEPNNPLIYSQLNSFDGIMVDTSIPTINYNQGALDAFEHDHAFLSKRTPVSDLPSSSNSTQKKKRESHRISSRLRSRAICPSPSESSSSSSTQTKCARNINRATDIKTSEDLSYYLERRRKNNEASKMSRAARKQKFGDMDERCEEYERVNTELRKKIATLETVTTSLKSGLVNNFQRKNS